MMARLRKFFLWTVFACGIVLISGALYVAYTQGGFAKFSLPAATSVARQISEPASRSRVVDADTLVVGGIRVRLDGISAPEKEHETYEDGKRFVADLMRNATQIICDLEGRKTHEREVGACWFLMADGRKIDPQEEAVKAGFARDCPRYSKGRYKAFETPASRALPLPPYC